MLAIDAKKSGRVSAKDEKGSVSRAFKVNQLIFGLGIKGRSPIST
jgi:hypothetical protein